LAWSPDGRQIAFVSRREGEAGVYLVNADGSHQTRLTTWQEFRMYFAAPVWSPDGRQIAFISNIEGRDQIYVVETHGSNQTRLTTLTTGVSTPAWSPDGRQIAFVTDLSTSIRE